MTRKTKAAYKHVFHNNVLYPNQEVPQQQKTHSYAASNGTLASHVAPRRPIFNMIGVGGPDNPISTKGVIIGNFTPSEVLEWINEIHIDIDNLPDHLMVFLAMIS